MYEDFAPKLARLLTEYSAPVEPGHIVRIFSPIGGLPLAKALFEAVLRRGGHPTVEAGNELFREAFFDLANDDQLEWVNPMTQLEVETVDRSYGVLADANTRNLGAVDQARVMRFSAARKPIRETFQRRHGDGSLRWCGAPWPAEANAQDAGMGLRAFTAFLYQALGLDRDDPVTYWQEFETRQDDLIEWLAGRKQVSVQGPGIDLTFNLAGRSWKNACGKYNLPDGEIFTGPVEETVNGRVEFNFPTRYLGSDYEGITLTFKDGIVVEATAAKNEDKLLIVLDTDEGARKLGEFAVGTNPFIQQYMAHTLYDEKIGGTIHMALGMGYPDTGNANKSAIHWDMVHDMRGGGEITVDGDLFYRAGEFQVA